ncbi:hypothetical protein [Actinomadura vinacea]|uniref:hypothetical protein n=1 Tax=Actinomadura vinacea TaxID=115336 RepID=UPI0031DBE12B
MSAATGTFHLSHPRLYGPAERTVIEPWLTQPAHQTMNAYAEVAQAEVVTAEDAAALLAVVERLRTPRPAHRTVLAEAA